MQTKPEQNNMMSNFKFVFLLVALATLLSCASGFNFLYTSATQNDGSSAVSKEVPPSGTEAPTQSKVECETNDVKGQIHNVLEMLKNPPSVKDRTAVGSFFKNLSSIMMDTANSFESNSTVTDIAPAGMYESLVDILYKSIEYIYLAFAAITAATDTTKAWLLQVPYLVRKLSYLVGAEPLLEPAGDMKCVFLTCEELSNRNYSMSVMNFCVAGVEDKTRSTCTDAKGETFFSYPKEDPDAPMKFVFYGTVASYRCARPCYKVGKYETCAVVDEDCNVNGFVNFGPNSWFWAKHVQTYKHKIAKNDLVVDFPKATCVEDLCTHNVKWARYADIKTASSAFGNVQIYPAAFSVSRLRIGAQTHVRRGVPADPTQWKAGRSGTGLIVGDDVVGVYTGESGGNPFFSVAGPSSVVNPITNFDPSSNGDEKEFDCCECYSGSLMLLKASLQRFANETAESTGLHIKVVKSLMTFVIAYSAVRIAQAFAFVTITRYAWYRNIDKNTYFGFFEKVFGKRPPLVRVDRAVQEAVSSDVSDDLDPP